MKRKAHNLTIALCKGKLLEPAMELLSRIGLLSNRVG